MLEDTQQFLDKLCDLMHLRNKKKWQRSGAWSENRNERLPHVVFIQQGALFQGEGLLPIHLPPQVLCLTTWNRKIES